MMLDQTKVTKQNKTGMALKTTIPMSVVNLLGLKTDDDLGWSIETVPGKKDSVRVYVEAMN